LQDCACLNAPSAPFYQLPISSAGKITQSVPFEKSFHVVGENEAKVYDHLRVELLFSAFFIFFSFNKSSIFSDMLFSF